MIENGAVTIIAYIGEDADSYREKMSRVYSKLHGYGYSIGQKRIATRGGLEDYNDSGSTGSDMKFCARCQDNFYRSSFNEHQCKCPQCGYHETASMTGWHSCTKKDDTNTPGDTGNSCGYSGCDIPNCTYSSHYMQGGEAVVTGYKCINCEKIYNSEEARAIHSCECRECGYTDRFHALIYVHKCKFFCEKCKKTIEGKPSEHECQQVCGVCIKDPCECKPDQGGNGGDSSGNPDPDPEPEELCIYCQNLKPECKCPQEEDCDEIAKANSEIAQKAYDLFVKHGLEDFAKDYHNSNVEYGMDLYKNKSDGSYVKSEEYTSGSSTNIKHEVINNIDQVTAVMLHSHPTQTGHSYTDIIGLANAFMWSDQTCNTSFVVSTSIDDFSKHVTYALVVEDPAKVAAFFASYQVKDGESKTLEEKIDDKDKELSVANKAMHDQLNDGRGYINPAEKSMYALAALIKQHDIGMSIMKLEDGGFRQRKSEIVFENNTIKLGKLSKCK